MKTRIEREAVEPPPSPIPPAFRDYLPRIVERLAAPGDEEVSRALERADTPAGYLTWGELRRQTTPPGWSPEELWAAVRWRRKNCARALPLLRDADGRPFELTRTDPLAAALHRIDTKERLSKEIVGVTGDPRSEVVYRARAALEEAYGSSLLAGARITRARTRELVRTGCDPTDREERMVIGTHRALRKLGQWSRQPLTPEHLFTMQATLTLGNLEDEARGRLRQRDAVRSGDEVLRNVPYPPAPARELPERIERLCAFANQEPGDELFLHPVLRAILLHHQLAHDQPFPAGNGRTARVVFLWSAIRAGYEWFRSLSISRAIQRERDRYVRTLRQVREDEGDVTYFVRHQVDCIRQEIDALVDFLERRAHVAEWIGRQEAATRRLNRRQLALVEHALKHPATVYTASDHCEYHGISQPTAWKDLSALVQHGLLDEERQGRRALYRASAKLQRLAGVDPQPSE